MSGVARPRFILMTWPGYARCLRNSSRLRAFGCATECLAMPGTLFGLDPPRTTAMCLIPIVRRHCECSPKLAPSLCSVATSRSRRTITIDFLTAAHYVWSGLAPGTTGRSATRCFLDAEARGASNGVRRQSNKAVEGGSGG
jgi:hypothetical protein